jgi:hypothetical protein
MIIPDGAQFTIYCLSLNEPTHVPDADGLKASLVRRTHSDQWYVIHGTDESSLYFGYYKTFTDRNQPAERQRAAQDRVTIAAMQDDNGNFPFARCMFVPLTSPDPDAPPEWDLRNAPGYWALQIAAYRGSPQRKQYAVDAVRAARQQGIQAFFYHGPSVSSVLIGTWPREAVSEQDESVAHSDEINKTVMVLPGPLPSGADPNSVKDPNGNPAKVVIPRVQVVDPTMITAMKQYPNNVVNGEVMVRHVHTKTGMADVADPSFLVVVPLAKAQEQADAGGGGDAPANPPPDAMQPAGP